MRITLVPLIILSLLPSYLSGNNFDKLIMTLSAKQLERVDKVAMKHSVYL